MMKRIAKSKNCKNPLTMRMRGMEKKESRVRKAQKKIRHRCKIK